jgi:hypothetical protein
MSGRHQPTAGADSAEAWQPRPFVVVMEDYDEDRINVRIPAAIGPRDAENQARDLRPGYMVLGVKEAA